LIFDLLIDLNHQGEGRKILEGMHFPPKGFYKGIAFLPKFMRKIHAGVQKSFKDLENNASVSPPSPPSPAPDLLLWHELQQYTLQKWGIPRLGFTEIPPQLVFKGKLALYKHALVVIQEMRKEFIEKAPTIDAGKEVI
jgi:epoxyqueuosine reductase